MNFNYKKKGARLNIFASWGIRNGDLKCRIMADKAMFFELTRPSSLVYLVELERVNGTETGLTRMRAGVP